jgi:hypothetical protein
MRNKNIILKAILKNGEIFTKTGIRNRRELRKEGYKIWDYANKHNTTVIFMDTERA